MPEGSIQAKKSASVFITSVTMEHGSIDIEDGAGGVTISGSRSGFTVLADGDIKVRKRTGSIQISSVAVAGEMQLKDNLITGTLQVSRNSFADVLVMKNTVTEFFLAFDQNRVDNDARIFDNDGAGSKRVQLNTVGGTLSCTHNDAPFEGGPNSAGHAEGQCF
jgi:hypothetical protein